jgi:hypothetical protein
MAVGNPPLACFSCSRSVHSPANFSVTCSSFTLAPGPARHDAEAEQALCTRAPLGQAASRSLHRATHRGGSVTHRRRQSLRRERGCTSGQQLALIACQGKSCGDVCARDSMSVGQRLLLWWPLTDVRHVCARLLGFGPLYSRPGLNLCVRWQPQGALHTSLLSCSLHQLDINAAHTYIKMLAQSSRAFTAQRPAAVARRQLPVAAARPLSLSVTAPARRSHVVVKVGPRCGCA